MSDLRPTSPAPASQVAALLRSAPFGLVIVGTDGTIAAANLQASRLLGPSPPRELPGLYLADLLADPGDAPLLDEMLRTAATGSRTRRAFHVRSGDIFRVVELTCWSDPAVQTNAQVLVMLSEAAESDQIELLRELVRRNPAGMAQLDSDLSVVHINHRWTEITGQPIEAAAGQGWLDVVDVDGRDDFVDALSHALERSEGLRGRLRVRTPSGALRWIEVSTTPLDSPGGALLSFEDTTEGQDAVRRADELSRVLEATRDLVAILGADGTNLVWLNEMFGEFLPEAALEQPFVTFLDDYSEATYVSTALPAVRDSGTWKGELTIVRNDGTTVPMAVMLVAHLDDSDQTEAISLVARDLSDLRAAQARVADSETRMAALVQHATDLAVLVDRTGTVVYASPAVERVLGHPPGTLDGIDVLELVHPDDLTLAYDTIATVLDTEGESRTVQLRIAHGDASYRHLDIIANNMLDNTAVEGIVLNAKDVTDQVEAAAQLAAHTYRDDLTGLPNRTLLLERMRESLRRARERRLLVGVLFLDLDRFNVVNESLGHAAGDDLLNEVASRIEGVIRPGDTVARLGGDEFAVIVGDMLRRGDAVVAARRIRKAVTQPISIGSDHTVVTTSIGIAIADGSEEPEDLLRDADTALRRAKDKGRDVAVVFDDHLRDQAVRRLEVENKLRSAIERDALEVHFQPVLNARTGKLAGAEALVRIRDEDGTLVMPGEFIDIAEDSGLIAILGHQVLVKSIRQAALWTRQHVPGQEPMSVAVNVSARQLNDPSYPEQIRAELETAGLAPTQLSLELTESALIDGNPVTEQSLQQLHDLGVHIGLDDFGTGFSSLAYLKRFPISFLKVDRSFVNGLGTDEDDSAIVRATIALAHGLNLRVVAEGVETEDQLALLRGLDCNLVQGFLFSKPVPAEDFQSFLGMRWRS
ncbi:MAG: EAL domain-containing protein [Acidimicrobiales bacterium]|nr:EAL domain-containing protein [Acidimicrobiales bacterium]RZV44834.1 MAG: EAL domain-containing protein [Acidimicrobiales bacterium]